MRIYCRGVPSDPGRIMAVRNCSHLLSQFSMCLTEESTVLQIDSVKDFGSRGRENSADPVDDIDVAASPRPVPMDSRMSG